MANQEIRTTYGRDGKTIPFNYYTKERVDINGRETIKVVGWGTYGRYSVLAGQSQKVALAWFDTEEEMETAMVQAGIDPASVNWSNKWMEPQVSVNHLPDTPDW